MWQPLFQREYLVSVTLYCFIAKVVFHYINFSKVMEQVHVYPSCYTVLSTVDGGDLEGHLMIPRVFYPSPHPALFLPGIPVCTTHHSLAPGHIWAPSTCCGVWRPVASINMSPPGRPQSSVLMTLVDPQFPLQATKST